MDEVFLAQAEVLAKDATKSEYGGEAEGLTTTETARPMLSSFVSNPD